MWHQKKTEEIIKQLQTHPLTGLSAEEIKLRQKKYGLNALPEGKKPSLAAKFLAQFKNLLVVILVIAAILSFLLGDIIDALAIFTIVIINASIGFVQDVRAEKTLSSLKEKTIRFATVIREKKVQQIKIEDLVPGDILIIEEGIKIPADGRLIESFSLRVDESILSGESMPVSKNNLSLDKADLPLGDRTNMIYKDTTVTAGRGKAVIVAIGIETELGKIAQVLSQTTSIKTPLTRELEKLGEFLTYLVGLIACIIFVLNIINQQSMIESFLISISLAVAAIPEGLPAIVTIVLSLGVKRLADKKTLVKKLNAVETLGAIRIIATDKTGTLTQNKINVIKIILSTNIHYSVDGIGYKTIGTFFLRGKIYDPKKDQSLVFLLKAATLSSNASLDREKESIIGDTTEGALIVAAERAKIQSQILRDRWQRVFEVPFSGERKMMSTIVQDPDNHEYFLFAKGAPEVILQKCLIKPSDKKKLHNLVKELAKDGLRSLAVGYKKLSKDYIWEVTTNNNVSEEGLTYLGIFAMQDILRPEIYQALNLAKKAGIRTIMITGDHRDTALAIAKQAGIVDENQNVLTENEVEKLNKKQLAREIRNGVNVFARISPLGKLKIIEAIKTNPHIQIAVTGDGVNDAPALKASHIGIAMGQTGTDLTREVADMVITDDNYATIITAIEEGRVIFANLVKFIRYLISCNISEVLAVILGVLAKLPTPLLPIQILWINLITDGLPALALGVDPPEPNIMKNPPRDVKIGIIHKKRLVYMIIEGSIMGLIAFLLFSLTYNSFGYKTSQTMMFSTLALAQLVHAFNNRSTRKSLFEIGFFTNKYLLGAVAISLFLQIMAVQTTLGNLVFKTEKLPLNYWLIVILVSSLPFFIVELKKQLRFRILP